MGSTDVTNPITSGEMPNCFPNTLICGKIGPIAVDRHKTKKKTKQKQKLIKFKHSSLHHQFTCHEKEKMRLNRQQAMVNLCHLVSAQFFASSENETLPLNDVLMFVFAYRKCDIKNLY